MTTEPQGGARTLSLDDLIMLNDELAALVRAGVPLEQTLGDMGRDLPGRLGRATAELAERIDRGASLPQALEAMHGAFPPVYRAAVEAGLRGGNLPVALEGLSHAARRIADLRRLALLAAIYPLIVILLAYALFVLMITTTLPTFMGVFDQRPPRGLRWLIDLGQSASWWWPIFPSVVVSAAVVGLVATRGRFASLRGWPVIGPLLADARLSSFCELLSLLVSRQTPLPEALRLAADAVGDAAIKSSAETLAAETRQARSPRAVAPAGDGAIPAEGAWTARRAGLPPFMLWLIASGQRREILLSLLGHTAETYRRRAQRRADWLCYYLPTLLTVTIGGVVTLCFALSLFGPLIELLNQIATHGMERRAIQP